MSTLHLPPQTPTPATEASAPAGTGVASPAPRSTRAAWAMIAAAQQVIRNAFGLLGVTAPESM